MKKKGQVIIYGLMLMIIAIVLALAFTGPIKSFVDNARNETSEFGGMNCSSTDISNFDKAACLSTDLSLPYFILIVIAIGGIYLTAKYLSQ